MIDCTPLPIETMTIPFLATLDAHCSSPSRFEISFASLNASSDRVVPGGEGGIVEGEVGTFNSDAEGFEDLRGGGRRARRLGYAPLVTEGRRRDDRLVRAKEDRRGGGIKNRDGSCDDGLQRSKRVSTSEVSAEAGPGRTV